ncbi:RidA family protein [Afipia massiliensis]|uniref:RidA family protein n=1 Tax=Afipia massiliensis TaxID=211460 RepID=A0A4U6BTK1_9BRAD|nr:RidA family protein [Afipia massiliensis]
MPLEGDLVPVAARRCNQAITARVRARERQHGERLMRKCLSIVSSVMMLAIAGVAHAQEKKVIATPDAPPAIGPYSQAIRAGKTVYLAGQVSIDPKTKQFVNGTIEEQTKMALDNLKAVLAADGLTMDHVVSTGVFLKDLNEFGKMNGVYGTYFKNAPPARATVEVARLPLDAKVEISAIAVHP